MGLLRTWSKTRWIAGAIGALACWQSLSLGQSPSPQLKRLPRPTPSVAQSARVEPLKRLPRATPIPNRTANPGVRPAAFHSSQPGLLAAREPLPQVPADLPTQSVPTETHAGSALQPRTVAQAMQPPIAEEIAQTPPTFEVDLTTALQVVEGQSPRIAFAEARYREAYARLAAAKVLWLPSIRAGVSFNHHDGNLQNAAGNILNVSRTALNAGLGVQSVGAGSPVVPGVMASFHASDAIYQPKIEGHAASARQAATQSARNDALLAAALAYVNLLRAAQELTIAETTHENAKQLAELTESFARAGEGPQADADRARTELVRRANQVLRGQEAFRVASARLAETLSVDPLTQIVPTEPTIVPIDLVSPGLPVGELLATGLSNRPELAEAEHLVWEAIHRYRREKHAPLLPSVLLGVSQGGFGGGIGGRVRDFDDRFDFDAVAFWELRNLGFGERAARDGGRSRADQARWLQAQQMDRVAREIVEAHAQVDSRQAQISQAERGVAAATDAYHHDLQRIQEGQGLPLEALQSLQALNDARLEYLRTVAEYNESQFRLQRALGWPIR